ncbi:hypothetical protein B1B04_12410 [Lysinibacillus sp. KCTC 33748]|uniref:DUF4064 domain-containing protein n=1 Tax=unclassified Lysinibacillus TaxID=2636778 RepID=UPI0009A6A673|nr:MULTISPECIES: DUF4064 domain-containing protein [unclassified Lysinibacillus]OXS73521.1 hypothetical protein B1B04_12410 [Lysinibacillus sp. KCTC 33748]SKB79332.1 hypothetical protein SAMN06295926_10883 [Lysinibacillus sp. AC-3]
MEETEYKPIEERFNEQNDNKKLNKQSKAPYTLYSVLGFIGAIISIGMGFYKMFVYESADEDSYFSSKENINAYVGGDAYNYIINGTYTTSYFVLALVCMVFACSMLILKSINQNK